MNEINKNIPPSKPTEIPKDLKVEKLARKIWAGCAILFAAALIVTCSITPLMPLAAAIAAITISALALAILLVPECSRRFSKKPGILAGFDYELFSLAAAIGTYFTGDKEPANKNNGSEPVLFIHGYLHNRTAWKLFKKRLRDRELNNPFYTISLGHPFQTIDNDYSVKVQKKIQNILAENPQCKTVKLVGHSMGGIVSACAENDQVSQVITLGSPLEGTKLAPISFGKCTKQMRRNAPLLKTLHEKMRRNPKKYFHYGSGGDAVILPHSSANPEGKGKKFAFLGHLSLLYSEQVVDEVSKDLKICSFTDTPV